jgi:hypothetical protein
MGQQSGWHASLTALQQQLPLLQHLPDHSTATALLGVLLVVLLIPRLRTLVWNTVETVLASLLLVVLVLVVLGLAPGAHGPFNFCFFSCVRAHALCNLSGWCNSRATSAQLAGRLHTRRAAHVP